MNDVPALRSGVSPWAWWLGGAALAALLVVSARRFGILPAAFAAVIAVSTGYLLRRASSIGNAESAAIGDGDRGYLAVAGAAERSPGESLIDPLTHTLCLWFGIDTFVGPGIFSPRAGMRSRGPVKIRRISSSRAFILRDATGACKVLPVGAQFALDAEPRLITDEKSGLTHKLWLLRPGDRIHVLGEIRGSGVDTVIAKPADRRPLMISDRSPTENGVLASRGRYFRVIFAACAIAIVLWLPSARQSIKWASADNRAATAKGESGATLRADRWRVELAQFTQSKGGQRTQAQNVAANEAVSRNSQAEEELRKLTAEIAILNALQQSDAHAVPGDKPAALRVIDDYRLTRVFNTTKRKLEVRLSRFAPKFRAQGRCRMQVAGARENDFDPVPIEPEVWVDFTLPRRGCLQPERQALEVEIYSDGTLIWASDAVLGEMLASSTRRLNELRLELGSSAQRP